jgi:hypothetical protein
MVGGIYMSPFELSAGVLFHPVETFSYIKSRRRPISYTACIVLLLLVVAVRITSIFITHFPIAAVQPREANIWLESLKLLVPALTWVIACYAVTTISDGEARLGEILAAVSYSMIPYIVFTIPVAALSNLMGEDQLGLYNTLQNTVWIWVLIVLFLSIKTLNDYTFGKILKVCVISIIGSLLIWGLFILIFALTSQLLEFIHDITLEFRMLFIK